MSLQGSIGTLYLVIVVLIVVLFLLVWRASKRKSESAEAAARFSRIGKIWILVLAVISGALTLITFPLIHYPAVASPLAENRQIVKVEAFQFGWDVQPAQIKAGVQVEFVVTSRDVNHGLGVIDPDGTLLFQVQAMPKYTNKAVYTFEKPGTYKIICLEYCGLAHHVMTVTFEVVP